MADLRDYIRTRRSIRQFRQKEIPGEHLRDCIEMARRAPSAANIQPLEYILVSAPDPVAKIFPLLRWAGYIQPEGNPRENRYPTAYIVVLVNTQIAKKWYRHDVGAAVENILLTAWTYGIGSCWLASVEREQLRELLAIPPGYGIDSIIALGYPDETPVVEESSGDIKYWKDAQDRLHVPKRPLDVILHINRF